MWTFAADYVDKGDATYANRFLAQMNLGRQCTLVDKYPGLMIIKDYYEWVDDAPLRVVQPQSSSSEYDLTGPTLSTPKHEEVPPATEAELEAVFRGELIDMLEDAYIGQFPQAEASTGAIPVVDIEEPYENPIYYIPAYLDPRAALDSSRRTGKPWFITMNDGEMPSYVFWQPKPAEKDSRNARSRAPTPEARPTTPGSTPATRSSPTQISNMPGASSSAPSLNTKDATEKPDQPMWDYEIFDPRLEEDPIEFLDFYNSCFKGWHGRRHKMMLREEDIDRANYISPCLAHNHQDQRKQADKETTTAGRSQTAAGNVNSIKDASLEGPSFTQPKNWVQPKTIAADDPAWKAFNDRLDSHSRIRKARIRPEPVFTTKYSNRPGSKIDSKKAVLTRDIYEGFYQRARVAQAEIDFRSKCCLACGLKWTKCETTRQDHYKQHREEFHAYTKIIEKRQTILEPEMRVETLDVSKVLSPKDVPGLNWFKNLEEVLLNLENELLEREQTCRICDKNIDFAYGEISDHYREHALERHTLRKVQDVAETTPQSPTVVTTVNGSVQISSSLSISPPARNHTRFDPNSPFMARHDKILEEQRLKRQTLAAKKVAANLVATGKEIERRGTVTTSESVQLIDSPLSEHEIVDLSAGIPQDDLGFLDGYDDAQAAPSTESSNTSFKTAASRLGSTRSTSDSPTEPSALDLVESFSKDAGFGWKATEEAKRILKIAENSSIFNDVPAKFIAISSVIIASKRGGMVENIEDLCRKSRVPLRHTEMILNLLDSIVEVELPSPTFSQNSDLHTLLRGVKSPAEQVIIISSDESSSIYSDSDVEIEDNAGVNSGDFVAAHHGPSIDDAEEVEDDSIESDGSSSQSVSSDDLIIDDSEEVRDDSGDYDSSDPQEWLTEQTLLMHIPVGVEFTDSLGSDLRNAISKDLYDHPQKLTPDEWKQILHKEGSKLRYWFAPMVLDAPADEDISGLVPRGNPVVPIENDGLDIGEKDLDLNGLLRRAELWGLNRNQLIVIHDVAWQICKDMVARHREDPAIDAPSGIRKWILTKIRDFVEFALEVEKSKKRREQGGSSPRSSSLPSPPTTSSSGSSRDNGWSMQAVRNSEPVSQQPSASSRKRKRPSPLPTPHRKRNVDEDEFEPGPPTPFNPDEISPRIPKVPRKNSDPNYRPRSAAFDPTSPPVTPKRTKSAERAAKKAEKTKALKGLIRQAEKAKKRSVAESGKKAKKVVFQPQEPVASSATPNKDTERSVSQKVAGKRPQKTMTQQAEALQSARPKRKAAVEAAKHFGKTKYVG